MSLVLAAFLFVVATGAAGIMTADSNYFANHQFTIKKMGAKWFVVDKDNKKEPIRANKADDITWTADGSDLEFTFPAEIGKYLQKVDGNYDGSKYTAKVEDGKKLKLKVKDGVIDGRYEYEVLVLADSSQAEGSSPPVIIIGGS